MKKSVVVSMLFSLVIVLLAVITTMGDASAQSLSSSLGVAPYPSSLGPVQLIHRTSEDRMKNLIRFQPP